MAFEGYYSRRNLGGSNASSGFIYQDYVALYSALIHLQDTLFVSVGVETDNDFSLLFENHEKYKVQVKDKEVKLSSIEEEIEERKFLIASSVDKQTKSFNRYLGHFRNNQKSQESRKYKLEVKKDFQLLLNKYFPKGLSHIPDSWNLIVLPDAQIEASVIYECINFSTKLQKDLNYVDCVNALLLKFAQCRKTRNYISRKEVLSIIDSYSSDKKQLVRVKNTISSFDEKNTGFKLGIDPQKILDTIKSQIELAEKHFNEREYKKSETIYVKLSKILETPELYAKCAYINLLLENKLKAQKYCDKGFKLSSRSFELLKIQAIIKACCKNYSEALSFFKSAKSINDNSAELNYHMGVNYISLENNELAIECFKKCIDIEPDNYAAYLNLAICCHAIFSYEKSLNYIETCLILKPELPEALSEKGRLKRFFGSYSEAIQLFNRCLNQKPDNYIANNELALALLANGDALGAALLVDNYATEIKNLAIGKEIGFVDICYFESFAYKLVKIDDYFVHVEFGGCLIQVAVPSNDMIGVGYIPKGDGVFPLIMKSYEHESHFLRYVDMVESMESCEGVRKVSGTLTDKLDHCEINLEFEHGQIWGKTIKTENPIFRSFIELYKGKFILFLMHEDSGSKAEFELKGIDIQ